MVPGLYVGSGDWTQVFVFVWQPFYWWFLSKSLNLLSVSRHSMVSCYTSLTFYSGLKWPLVDVFDPLFCGCLEKISVFSVLFCYFVCLSFQYNTPPGSFCGLLPLIWDIPRCSSFCSLVLTIAFMKYGKPPCIVRGKMDDNEWATQWVILWVKVETSCL